MLLSSWETLFPQVVGILPPPFSTLLLPWSDTGDISAVLRLRFSNTPPEWGFLKRVYEGNFGKAKEELKHIEDEELRDYTRRVLDFALSGDITVLKGFEGSAPLKALLQLLIPGEVMGVELEDRPDLTALSHFMKAKYIRKVDPSEAMRHLDTSLRYISFESPVFKANVLLMKANLLYNEKGASYHLIQLYSEILTLLKDTNATLIKGEVLYQLGNLHFTFGNTDEAVKNFTEALEYFSIEEEPYMYAMINNNMGLAYLSTQPTGMESQVRLALGVQCLRKALEVFSKENYPKEWASATLNYANALVYLPTADPKKNLLKALELYKEVLSFREEMDDKEGVARVLANMGNALAHLGIIGEARKYLERARDIFIGLGLGEEASGVEEILREIRSVEVSGDGR